jgi:hypothetical protein
MSREAFCTFLQCRFQKQVHICQQNYKVDRNEPFFYRTFFKRLSALGKSRGGRARHEGQFAKLLSTRQNILIQGMTCCGWL